MAETAVLHGAPVSLTGAPRHGKERLETLSDGVFAIAMTLLVLEIKFPELPHDLPPAEVADKLLHALLSLGPKMVSYVVSFVVIGVYWNAHRIVMQLIHRVDHALTWLNIWLLLSISFVPFIAFLAGTYPGQQIAVMLYGFTLTITGLSLYSMYTYAMHRDRLTDHPLPRPIRRFMPIIFLLPPTCYASGAALALVDPRISTGIYIVLPILYIFRGWIDFLLAHIMRRHNHHQHVAAGKHIEEATA